VLAVDDEADARELMTIALEQAGATVTAVASAQAAFTTIAQPNGQADHPYPDVIVSDIAMPEEDGYSLIRKVRARTPQQGGHIPAIALTAYARDEDANRAVSEGFQMHLAKPINPARLIDVVAHCVES
jgi:CheY-like chemotaxis protein